MSLNCAEKGPEVLTFNLNFKSCSTDQDNNKNRIQ